MPVVGVLKGETASDHGAEPSSSLCTELTLNTATVGSIACNYGYTAGCAPAPAASQTTYVECDSVELSNGVARDWWYWRLTCDYPRVLRLCLI